MYCDKCGAEIKSKAKFCVKCGTPIQQMNQQSQQWNQQDQQNQQWNQQDQQNQQWNQQGNEENIDKPAKSKKKLAFIIVAAMLVVYIAGLSIYFLSSKGGIGSSAPTPNNEEEWQEYTKEVEDWIGEQDKKLELFVLNDDLQSEYDTLVEELNQLVADHKKAKTIDRKKAEFEDFYERAGGENKNAIQDQVSILKADDTDFAIPDDLDRIAEIETEINECIEQSNYAEANRLVEEWKAIIAEAAIDYSAYQVSVRQYDLSEYPNVKLYLDVVDSNGNFVDNLGPEAFFVNEGRRIGGRFNRATLVKAAKLNQNEGISIGLVADVSGSMEYNMGEAKAGMKDFIKSVQFSKGDEIEIVEFSDEYYVCQSFTNDVAKLNNSIDAMIPDGCTRLYDTLINEVSRISSCSNAKCIIGFTDGYDNVSIYGAADVVDYANRYNIPIFLIGVGSDCDESSLRYISESTGGIYRRIDYMSDLSDIYGLIYTQQKEAYYIEYETSESDNLTDPYLADIYVRADGGVGGKIEGFTIQSTEFFDSLYTRFLVAGVDCQTKGERNLIDSGLIVKNEAAFADKEAVAYQCQTSINKGGIGTANSRIYEVLVDHAVLRVIKESDGYILYGRCTYNISKERMYSKAKDIEKEYINYAYGYAAPNSIFWLEERITNYEKLKIIKDTDGQWRIYSRVYERQDGESAISIDEVYRAVFMQ